MKTTPSYFQLLLRRKVGPPSAQQGTLCESILDLKENIIYIDRGKFVVNLAS